MFPEQLKKILKLVKRTGDKVVIFDGNNPDDSYVIMDFDKYADQAEVAPSSVSGEGNNLANNQVSKSESPLNLKKNDNLTEEDLTDKINREISMWKNRDVSSFLGDENKPKNGWQIPPKVKDKAQEVE